MRDYEGIQDLINEVECKPFLLRFDCIQCVREGIQRHALNCMCASCLVGETSSNCAHPEHSWFVQATLKRQDTHTGQWGMGYGGKNFLSPHMTDGEIVKKCFVACRDYAEHEVREAFMWRGRRILGPHISIQSLWDVAEQEETRDAQTTLV